jgi:hypothetical protein
MNNEAEFQGQADHRILDNVVVSEQFGEFKTEDEAKASLRSGTNKDLYELDGKVWDPLTDLDLLVLNGREVVRWEEVKAGSPPAKAKAQQKVAIEALERIAAGDGRIRLHHHQHTDITDQIDASSADASKAQTTGPANRKFERSLGVTEAELSQLVREILTGAEQAAKKVDE